MTWEQVLLAAAKATGVSEATAKAVQAQLAKGPRETKEVAALLAALDAALRAKWKALAPEPLATARAAVWSLEQLLREGDDPRETMVQKASVDAEREAAAIERYGEGTWQCARCGSQRIEDEHTGRDRMRFIQLLCDACGASGDGSDGDASLEAWKRK
jgi:hypothetical protein